MNDAYRGALIVGAAVALWFAVRLAAVEVQAWRRRKRDPRRHGRHALWMTVGLIATCLLLVELMWSQAGVNRPLEWQDLLRAVQVSALTAGLLPLWSMHARERTHAPPEKETL